MKRQLVAVAFVMPVVICGCSSIPTGPSVAVMPAPGKPFDLFVAEERECRQFAQQSIGTTANQAATESAVKSAAVGTAIGAAAGALAGGHEGAGSGAAFGLLAGAVIGSDESQYSGNEAQRRYDIAYEQCMYAKGNQLPQGNSRPRVIYSMPPAPSGASGPVYYPPASSAPPASSGPVYYPPAPVPSGQ
jgi:hypothetical protein